MTEAPVRVKIKRIADENGAKPPMPSYATGGSAGMDLRAFCDGDITIAPGSLVVVPTGVAVELPSGTVGIVAARSGLGVKHGITLSNGIGVIDSDYRGEIRVGLCNVSDKPYTIHPGDRIAQLLVMPVVAACLVEAEELSPSERGEGGFGSTGR